MRLILTALAILAVFSAKAQITLTNSYFPQAGDTLRSFFAENLPDSIPYGLPGGPQVWDFTFLEAGFLQETVFQPASLGSAFDDFPDSELFTELSGTGQLYYNVEPNKVEYLGYLGPDPAGIGLDLLVPLSEPLRERTAPLGFLSELEEESSVFIPFSFDDIPGNVLDSLFPIQPDSLRITINITREELVDAYGTMQIPYASHEVLRLRRDETRETRLEAKIFIWLDVTDLIPANPFLGEITTRTYFFYANDVKEPVAQVNLDVGGNVTSVQYRQEEIIDAVSESEEGSLRVYPNPTSGDLNLESDYPLSFTLYDLPGRPVWTGNGSQTHIGHLAPGIYWLVVRNEKGEVVDKEVVEVVR